MLAAFNTIRTSASTMLTTTTNFVEKRRNKEWTKQGHKLVASFLTLTGAMDLADKKVISTASTYRLINATILPQHSEDAGRHKFR